MDDYGYYTWQMEDSAVKAELWRAIKPYTFQREWGCSFTPAEIRQQVKRYQDKCAKYAALAQQ